MGHQPAGHAGVERADDEGKQLVAERAHAHHRGRHVLVADRDERPADLRAEQVLGEEDGRHHQREDQVEHADVGIQFQTEHSRGRDRQADHALGHALPVDDPVRRDEVRGQRGDGQVQALETQRRNAEDQANARGREGAERDRQVEGHAEIDLEDRGRIGAHGQERSLPDGDLPGVPDQDVQADRADDGDADAVEDVEPVGPGEARQHGQHGQQEHEGDDRHRRVEDALVAPVADAESPALHTRSISRLPKNP